MSNFEKFQNKQLPEAIASKVMGGALYQTCASGTGPDAWCLFPEYTNALALGACSGETPGTPGYFACLDAVCLAAIETCTIQ